MLHVLEMKHSALILGGRGGLQSVQLFRFCLVMFVSSSPGSGLASFTDYSGNGRDDIYLTPQATHTLCVRESLDRGRSIVVRPLQLVVLASKREDQKQITCAIVYQVVDANS